MEIDMKPTPIGRFCDTPSYEELRREVARLRLTDAERVDVAMWLSECLRQCSLAADGGSEEVAERWRHRSERAAQMLERLR
jgi:hypothetical protein